jgi:putative copper resistance protein D
MILLLAVMAFHAFLGVALLGGSTVLAEDWFAALQRPWGGSLLSDQRLGGGIAWAIGEIPTLVLEVVMAVQWSRSDEREARRRDRQADRDGDAELGAYNAMLARLAASDHSSGDGEVAGRHLPGEKAAGPTARDSKEP